MEEESSLDPPVESLEPLLFVARGLIERLGERIANGGYAVTKLRLMLTLDVSRAERENGAARVQAVLRLPSPMGGADDLWLPVSTLIRHQQIKRPVVAISLRVSGFCPASSRQLDLLTRRDGTLELLVRQLALLQDSPVTVRVPEVCAHGSILEERRFHWRDPVEVLQRRAARSVA